MMDLIIYEGANELDVQMIPLVADIRLENLKIEQASPEAGRPVYISIQATNYGTGTGSKSILCQVSPLGYEVSQTVTLTPGQSKTVSWMPYIAEPGTYQVSVDGLTGSFTVTGIIYSVGIGIYDESVVSRYIAGAVTVDETRHYIGVPYTYLILSLKDGWHTFELPYVPPGYIFLRWDIYDWATDEVISQKTEYKFKLMVDRELFIQAVVRPG